MPVHLRGMDSVRKLLYANKFEEDLFDGTSPPPPQAVLEELERKMQEAHSKGLEPGIVTATQPDQTGPNGSLEEEDKENQTENVAVSDDRVIPSLAPATPVTSKPSHPHTSSPSHLHTSTPSQEAPKTF